MTVSLCEALVRSPTDAHPRPCVQWGSTSHVQRTAAGLDGDSTAWPQQKAPADAVPGPSEDRLQLLLCCC